ncbi:MAG: energy transducer TonB [Bacteroidota bacterium]|nr:energy transducer TonB [Bacteroidota bacterium]
MKKTILFNNRACLTLEAIKKYGQNLLTRNEKKLVLQHLESCELCSDAIDGLVPSTNSEKNISSLRDAIAYKTGKHKIVSPQRKNRYLTISIAASVAIIVGLFFLLSKSTRNNIAEKNGWSKPGKSSTIITPPKPITSTLEKQDSEFHISTEKHKSSKKLTQNPALVSSDDFSGQVFSFTDEMPEFPGGIAALDQYMKNSIREAEEKEKVNSCGLVYVNFVVNESGRIAQTKIVNGHNRKLDKIARKIIEGLPAWKPGKQSGQLVKVTYTLPVRFENC